MASQEKELSDQDELIADLLGQGWTHQRVADSVDVSSKTVQRRMSDPAFSKVVSSDAGSGSANSVASSSPLATAPWTC